MKKLVKRKILTSMLGMTLLSSCATTSEVKHNMKTANDAVDTATKKLENSQNQQLSKFVYDMDSIYISHTPVKRKETEVLPPVFLNQIQIDSTFDSMRQIADTINKLTNYPVLLNVDDKELFIRVTQQNGSLYDLLNNIAAKTDTTWSYRSGKIVLSDIETKTYFIKSLPGSVEVSNQVNSNNGLQGQTTSTASLGSGGGSGGGSSSAQSNLNTIQNVKFDLTSNIWSNLDATIKSMLSSKGKITIMPATSSITVTDKPSILVTVDDFINKQKEMLKRQVQIDVQVIAVETNDTDNYGINWGLVLKGANASLSINGQPPVGTSTTAGAFVPVFSPNSTTQSFTIGANTGDLTGSQLIINALSEVSKTASVTSASGWTLNNQPVPIQVIRQQGYVASVSTTQVSDAGTQQAINTGQVNYGFTLNILPNIEDNGLINLQMSLNLSSLNAMRQYAIQDASVQQPDVTQRNTMQRVTMRAGDTYVLTGFDSDFNSIMTNGVGGASNWLFGGGSSAQRNRTKLVILITPKIINI